MIRRILVATDGSSLADRAVLFAAGLAKQMKAGITVVGVVDLTALFAPGGIAPIVPGVRGAMAIEDAVRRAVEEQVDRAARMVRKKGIPTRSSVRSGRPVDEIVKEAKRDKAGMIVLGSRGRSAINAVVLGSVAYGVIHKSTGIPVLTVRK